MLSLLSEEDIRYILELLADEMSRKEGKSFGYAEDPQICRLQAMLSVMLEVRTKQAMVGPHER